MDIRQIHYFLNLAQTLNFTEAARQSGVSQPSLTRAIQRLEEELRGPLLYRDGKDTRLTELGREIQIEFMRVQASLKAVADIAENSVLGRRRRLSIGLATTVAPTVTTLFWQHVLDQLPMTELQFLPLLPGEDENEILSGKYHLCLMTDPPKPNPKLTILPLYRERLQVALAASHPLASQAEISQQQVAGEPYLDRLHCEFRSQLVAYFMDRDIVMRPRVMSEREDWVQQLVASGAGVCSLPDRSVIVEGIVLRPLEGLELSRQVTLVGVSGSGNPKEVRQILTMAAKHTW
ncbi:DNA-binding transcriptional LysR family regulator [Bosea sp. BE271]|jgi:DNA-binding transcriptional LysR family regulator|uniref:LysR family transcriptional regulator n=1 Tax=Bosea TaxID=85413 RepID=UPI0028590014|nr:MULTISPECIES: LysR family transcriptional regulator [Bosea]MDR6831415.1 DNA-binding transcriptional LysR family regulator [Bosea robiniae]MDR6898161.1 DNA-binding transcriptional LysR family regulator [Bosea sp. BE109]MDR7141551.1 DNA-binding transcriptional LysR family regulator [Bosea sp. BE168]MDR7178181.1 DNA-binding transcriptional LysR family regulator [Bosea sp. BE271]